MPSFLSDIAGSDSSRPSGDGECGFERTSLRSPSPQRPQPFLHALQALLAGRWATKLGLGLAVVGLTILTWIWLAAGAGLDPYTEAVLSLEGQPSHGASLFALNCAACHGEEADGRVGPSLRGVSSRRSDRFIIHQVTSGKTPPMPQFQPDPQEMADLLSYLKTL